MTTIIPRTYQRSVSQVPLQYALLDTEQFHPSRTYDFSDGGLCFEAHEALKPGADVCIVMEQYDPDLAGLEGYHSYVASIRWAHLRAKNGTKSHVVGARFITRSHDILATENQLPRHFCDLCSTMMPLNKMETTHGGAQLCPHCMKHFQSIPSGKPRQCVERFLVGNVI